MLVTGALGKLGKIVLTTACLRLQFGGHCCIVLSALAIEQVRRHRDETVGFTSEESCSIPDRYKIPPPPSKTSKPFWSLLSLKWTWAPGALRRGVKLIVVFHVMLPDYDNEIMYTNV